MSERNWDQPKTQEFPGDDSCDHSELVETVWNTVAVSRMAGKKGLGNLVLNTWKTSSCQNCEMASTDLVDTQAPTEEDLAHYFGGHLRIPKSILKSLQDGTTDASPDEDEGEAARLELEEDREDEELDLSERASRPKPSKTFWRGLKTYKILEKWTATAKGPNKQMPCPFTSPANLLRALMPEVHAITGEHSHDHLIAAIAAGSKHITSDLEEIRKFVQLIRDMQYAEQNPIQEALVRFWGLGILPDSSSWLPAASKITQTIFTWLGCPLDKFLPKCFWTHKDAVIGEIGKRGKTPEKAKGDDNELEERIKKDLVLAKKRADERVATQREALAKVQVRDDKKILNQFEVKQVTQGDIGWDTEQATLLLRGPAKVRRLDKLTYSTPSGSNAVYLPPPTPEFEGDMDHEWSLTRVELAGDAGISLQLLNLTDAGLTVRVAVVNGVLCVLVCPPTSGARRR